MKIKRAPLLGAIGSILIIISSLITIHSQREYAKLEVVNNSLNLTIAEQATTIESLKEENNQLTIKISNLEKDNKQLKNKSKVITQPKEITQTTNNSAGLGQFKITAYCNCSKCCGKWAGGPTASGTTPTAGRTVAVDPKVIPLGTKVVIDGHTYVAEDTGSAIKGRKIDMFFSSHSEAMAWGVKHKNVSIVK